MAPPVQQLPVRGGPGEQQPSPHFVNDPFLCRAAVRQPQQLLATPAASAAARQLALVVVLLLLVGDLQPQLHTLSRQ
jgi:hypothetical protein